MSSNYADLATLLARGISHCRMYFADHPNVNAAAREFQSLLTRLLDEGDQDTFLLGVAGDKLIHEGRFLVGPSIVGSRLAQFAEHMQSGGFEFARNVSTPELKAFFSLAAKSKEPVADHNAACALFASRGMANITLSPVYNEGHYEESEEDADEEENSLDSLIPVYQSLFNTVERAHQNAELDRELDMTEARNVGEQLVKASRGSLQDIMHLVKYPDFDSYTVGHSVRVAMLSVLVGRQAGLSEDVLAELSAAGLLHDVGTGKIPQEILFKPGKLDDEERRVIETHPAIGAAMLLENREAGPLAVAVAWGHHRRNDGGGYPKMPHGNHISELTQLVHVCDVFEALTAVRPYKRALTPRHAYEIILRDRHAYSPLAITALKRSVGLYPPGSQVILSSGERAVVTAASSDIVQPCVRITHDAQGNELDTIEQLVLDLSAAEDTPTVKRLLIGA